jgi:alpha-aminoadipate carrier protein LysW
MNSVQCPECAGTVEVADDAVMAEILVCADCGVELEVMSLAPLRIALAPEVDEDWGE